MKKTEDKSFYKISSTLNAEHRFNYRDGKKVVNIAIAGKYRPNDVVAPTYITEADYVSLMKEMGDGRASPFSFLLEKGINGGIVAEKTAFAGLPAEWQKKIDPQEFERREQAKKDGK